MYEYPYGNSQQLNLDWILNKVKEFENSGASSADMKSIANALLSASYDADSAYAVNDVVYNDTLETLYICNTAIPVGGEPWDATHWDAFRVGEVLTFLFNTIQNLPSDNIANNSNVTGTGLTAALNALVEDIKYSNHYLQQKKNGVYTDVIPIEDTPSNNSDRLASSKAAYDLKGAINALTDNKNLKIISGAIRNAGSGWSLINDGGHEPLNITGVSVQSVGGNSVLKIEHDVDATKIITLMVGCDETFASLYDIGASVGLDYSYLYVYRKAHTFGGMVQVVNNAIDTQYSDFTAGTFYPDGNFVLNFPETLTESEDVFSAACAGGEGCTAHVKSLGYTNAIVRANALDGTAWDSSSYPNQTRIYLTFNVRERLVDPSTIVNANGNFWIIGIMETA